MRRTSCSACGCSDLDLFLDLGLSPIADAYTAGPLDETPMFPLQVAVCAKCRLVQLMEIVDAGVLFGTGYSFYSSASAPLSQYHRTYAQQIIDNHESLARQGVIEVGCNDGDLLRWFDFCPALGVDPAIGPATAAAQRGLDVRVAPFGLAEAHRIRDDRGLQGIVIANHVLAHVQDVSDVLAGIKALLGPSGLAFVEVQYLPDLLLNNAFDLVYHEHRNFFSLSCLEQAAARVGLAVLDVRLTQRQGGSMRVTLGRSPQHRRIDPSVAKLRSTERWLQGFGAYDGMQGRADRVRARLLDLLGDQSIRGATVAGYGAPAKATTLLNFCGIDVQHLSHCVDTTAAKRGRYIPGTGIPIVAPDDAPKVDAYLLLAWNYATQIMRANAVACDRWIIPFPAPVIL